MADQVKVSPKEFRRNRNPQETLRQHQKYSFESTRQKQVHLCVLGCCHRCCNKSHVEQVVKNYEPTSPAHTECNANKPINKFDEAIDKVEGRCELFVKHKEQDSNATVDSAAHYDMKKWGCGLIALRVKSLLEFGILKFESPATSRKVGNPRRSYRPLVAVVFGGPNW